MKLSRFIVTISSGLGLFASLFASQATVAAPQQIDVMFYNVYNLFDNKKDQGKDDWTWLPSNFPGKNEECRKIPQDHYRKECLETNWTSKHVALKVSQLARAVSLNQRSMVPDILGLCEVENISVVQALAKTLGYDPRGVISTSSPDKRGIDVALIYRPSPILRYRSHKEYKLPISGALTKPTRNILEVEFIVGEKEQLFVYVNHWPSQGAPSPARVLAAKMLRSVIEARVKQNPNANIIATGDFNTIPTDRPHPFHDELLKSNNPMAQLADVHTTFMRHPKIPDDMKKQFPPGTYYYTYGKEWSLLDRFFVNRNMFDGKGLDFAIANYRINNPSFLTRPWELRDGSRRSIMIPSRPNTKTLDPKNAGYSDHFGIRGTLILN